MATSPPPPLSGPRGAAHGVTLQVRSFRTFRDPAKLALRPLTLLYGQNQAGKSSLLRLVPLLADSLKGAPSGLDLESAALCGATFKELGWMGRDPRMSPRIDIVAGDDANAPALTLALTDDGGPLVNDFRLHRGNAEVFNVLLDAPARREATVLRARYAGKYRGQDWSSELAFSRLIPEGLPPDAAGVASDIEQALERVAGTQWLHANRLADGERGARPRRGMRADGTDLAGVLGNPEHRVVLQGVSSWLQRVGLADEIKVGTDGDGRPRFVLALQGKEALPVHLAGEGVRSVLPILLHTAWAEAGLGAAGSTSAKLLAIEEPEAHLHPNLQVALLERLLEAVRIGVHVVLETHSVFILRAMQVAVLRGDLAPSEVSLNWIEQGEGGSASVVPVDVRADATLSGWQPGTFEMEQELAHQILDLRWHGGAGP